MGMGALGLSSLLSGASLNPLSPKAPHFRPRAKRIIHLFMNGGPSHVDTFDPKPMLQKHAGKMLPMPNLPTERKTGAAFGSPYSFSKYGQSGLPVSEIFPHTARHMDDICVLRSMRADVPNHEPSLMLMNCGESIQVRPSMGSWLTYGLGTENQNLPGFIAMCPGYPIQESQNWQCGFLPGSYQGTYIDTRKKDVDELIQHIRNPHLSLGQQRRQLDLLRKINERHAKDRQNEPQLEARIHSFELAYRMQMEATDAFDISREPEHIRKAYGSTTQARQILIARRLIERGVRYVQVWHGNSQPWDNHDDIEKGHRFLAKQCDQAIGALLSDLKQRGLLEDTIVMWGGEFGRTPTVELPKPGSNAGKINGRDHNHHGFSMWLAGGGVRGGMAYGATDEFGFKAVENVVHVHDLHATILHLMGFDHEQLTFRHAGRDFRLTDVHGHVVHDIIS
tara:strand:+ start:612 stop:1961 length:1350 start_codon:yes stop_codon:yes gene_type:complete